MGVVWFRGRMGRFGVSCLGRVLFLLFRAAVVVLRFSSFIFRSWSGVYDSVLFRGWLFRLVEIVRV